jgi:hypothetical protein
MNAEKLQLEQQLWNIANTLRGKMGADDFRDYIYWDISLNPHGWKPELGHSFCIRGRTNSSQKYHDKIPTNPNCAKQKFSKDRRGTGRIRAPMLISAFITSTVGHAVRNF